MGKNLLPSRWREIHVEIEKMKNVMRWWRIKNLKHRKNVIRSSMQDKRKMVQFCLGSPSIKC